MLLYQLSRLLFYMLNPTTGSSELLNIFLASSRYDITAICILNVPVILLHLYPSSLSLKKGYQGFISGWMIVANAIGLLLNCIDAAWFPYVQKRNTAEVFTLLATGDDVTNNIGQYLADFWYVLIFWMALVYMLVLAEKKFRKSIQQFKSAPQKYPVFLLRLFAALFLLAAGVIGFRGGLQLKPLSIQAAARMVPSSSIPLVLNTPYTIIKSIGESTLPETQYLTNSEAAKIFPIHQSMSGTPNGKNVVVIIMESFSHEYISYYHPDKKTTPFLDSLMRVSHCWPNTFANAKRSIEGVPAVVASLPHLMDQAFINSVYNITPINSAASLLKPVGYSTSFFHGGNNGTMGFDNFTRLAGFETYFGRNEYDGPASDYDGNWGIYDDAFRRFMTRTLSRQRAPFFATFFSLSSHHPYNVPSPFSDKIPSGFSPIERGMAYADASLRVFFEEAARTSWYANTVFVITADHSGPAGEPYYAGRLGAFHIPLLIFSPGDSTMKTHPETAQQTDILPSILHLTGYKGKYTAFGRNLFAGTDGWAVNYANKSWSLINEKFILQFDGQESTHLYLRADSLLTNNLLHTKYQREEETMERFLKAILQQHNDGLIHHTLVKQP